MQGLSQLVLAFLELVEAEGRTLRSGFARVASVVVVLLVAALLALTAFGMLIWALFLGFAVGAGITAGWAAFWTGIITLFVSGVLMWIATNMAR